MDSLYIPATPEGAGLYKTRAQGATDLPNVWRSHHFPVLYNREGCESGHYSSPSLIEPWYIVTPCGSFPGQQPFALVNRGSS
jgi:hypothetical protein